jgi:hypothetical protein
MAVCRKSSDATNVRWEPCAPDQDPDRDSPLGYLIASGIFVASYRAVPVARYLRVRTLALKGLGKRFEPRSERFGATDELGVGRRRDLRGGFGAFVDQLVG